MFTDHFRNRIMISVPPRVTVNMESYAEIHYGEPMADFSFSKKNCSG